MAWAPWAITTIVSCLPVLVLGMGTALAHMLRADAEAAATADAPDSQTGPLAALRSVSESPEDQEGPDRRRPEADRDLTMRRDQNGPEPGSQYGHGIMESGPRPTGPGIDQARVIAQRLAAAGKPVSRRALRSGEATGSNEALSALARVINTELAGCADGGRPGNQPSVSTGHCHVGG
jgi:hypothetical protein